jgi:hypothetical protein
MTDTPGEKRVHAGHEIIVPAIMLGSIGLYLYDVMGLSSLSLMFPAVLIAVIAGALLWLTIAALLGTANAPEAPNEGEESELDVGPVLDVRPWALVLLPAFLLFGFEYLGALPALIALVFGAQMILGQPSPIRSLVLAVAVTAPTYFFFQHFLYVRFPHGLFGIG